MVRVINLPEQPRMACKLGDVILEMRVLRTPGSM